MYRMLLCLALVAVVLPSLAFGQCGVPQQQSQQQSTAAAIQALNAITQFQRTPSTLPGLQLAPQHQLQQLTGTFPAAQVFVPAQQVVQYAPAQHQPMQAAPVEQAARTYSAQELDVLAFASMNPNQRATPRPVAPAAGPGNRMVAAISPGANR